MEPLTPHPTTMAAARSVLGPGYQIAPSERVAELALTCVRQAAPRR